ncbi:unnamed protein product, partial [Polarella glacialis]
MGLPGEATGPLERKEAGNQFFKEGNWQLASAEYTFGLEEGGEDFPGDQRGLLLSNRSQCWLNLSEYQKALEDADACLKLLPEHSKSLFRRASAQEKLGRKNEALKDFARVARAEPGNHNAIEAAKRLRDEVLKEGQQRQEECLPSHLLDVLRADSSVEAQLEACGKLRALCIRRGQTAVLLAAGGLELLLRRAAEDATAEDLRQACLSALVAMASGQEESDDDGNAAARNSGPLPVPSAAAEARKRLRAALPLASLQRLCRGHAGSLRQLATLLGFCFQPEDEEALEVLDTTLSFIEGGELDVPRAGLAALTSIFDARRRQGKAGKAVVPSRALFKCLESALGTSNSGQLLRSLLAEVFTLLADDDRGKGSEVDLPEIGLRVLEPFLQSQ